MQPDVFLYVDGNTDDATKAKALDVFKPVRYAWCDRKLRSNQKEKMAPHLEMMFYCIEQCNALKKQEEGERGLQYDVVIRIRPDLFIRDYIPDSIIDKCVRDELLGIRTIYAPLPCAGAVVLDADEGVQDQVALASSRNMDVYSCMHAWLIHEYEPRITCSSRTCLFPEFLLKHYLVQKDVAVEWFLFSWFIYEFRMEWSNVYACVRKLLRKRFPIESSLAITPFQCRQLSFKHERDIKRL
jgi:hypothetical protein